MTGLKRMIGLPGLITNLTAGAETLSRGVLSPVPAYYFLRDRETFTYTLSLWIPRSRRKRVLTAIQGMRRETADYIREQLLISLAVGVLTAAGLFLVGLPAWLTLGILMGFCEFIPYMGPFLGAIPIALFALPRGSAALLWAMAHTVGDSSWKAFSCPPS